MKGKEKEGEVEGLNDEKVEQKEPTDEKQLTESESKN